MKINVLSKLARSLYSLLTPDNRNFLVTDTKFWVACPDILIPSRMVGITSNFSPMWSPFVFKMLRSCKSGFIKQPVIFDISRGTPCSFTSALLIEGDTEAETTVFTSFAWKNLQFSGMVTLGSRFSSAIFERVFLNATLVTSSDAGYPQFSVVWL